MKRLFAVLFSILMVGVFACSSGDESGPKDVISQDTIGSDTNITCAALNQACTVNEDCCSGLECDPNTKKCRKPLLDNGKPCSSDDSCK